MSARTALDEYHAFRAGNPDPRAYGYAEAEREARCAYLTESGQTVADLEAIKADCGGVWHPGWEERLVNARARHKAAVQARRDREASDMARAA